jgi:glycerol kinase
MTQRPQSGWVEHDADEVVNSVRRAAAQAIAQLSSEQKQQLDSAGLVTQRSSLVCWNKNTHRPLTAVISWQDIRGKALLEMCPLDREDIQQRTGLVVNAHLGASKYQWCLQNLSVVKEAFDAQQLLVGPLASYLVYQLCDGHPHAVDPANAARTLLWNIQRNDWDDDLLAVFALPRKIFPQLKPTLAEWGELQIDDIRLPLRLLNGDQSSAIFGFGSLLPDTAYVNIGTGAFISLPMTELPEKIAPLLCSPCLWRAGIEQPLFLLEGTVHGANSALYDWADKRGKILTPDNLHAALLDSQPAIFLNGIGGVGSPDWISEFPSRFVNSLFVNDQRGAQTANAQLGGILESIVFLLQRNLQILQQRHSVKQLLISGGLSQLDGVCQRLADLSGLPVVRPQDCEATALGIANCLAGQPEKWPVLHNAQWFVPEKNSAFLQRYVYWQSMMFA